MLAKLSLVSKVDSQPLLGNPNKNIPSFQVGDRHPVVSPNYYFFVNKSNLSNKFGNYQLLKHIYVIIA
jgi:hypothetical protein